ncbi:hypothetical protein D9M72_589450 [compost metagenome]
MIIPDIFKQHRARNHLSGMTHQIFKQTKLSRLKRDIHVLPSCRVSKPVKFQIADAIDCICFART